ncbi:hypothetical protein BDR06DRAFT_984766 [Suillus hirtellus]|nr:hypothetical protein BDR06DRAFT_984766 [Suillus hirtellus]
MAQYEAWMVQYEGPKLKKVEPHLKPGEKRIIAQFHDECCFHANDQSNTSWLQSGEQPLCKKGQDGELLRDACKIIYPGSNGDPWFLQGEWKEKMMGQCSDCNTWWDSAQFLEQVKNAIDIFMLTHPDSFEMNKSDKGKQRKQCDTVIPMNNPNISVRGKVQKMTNKDGTPKGLHSVLTKRGFDVRWLKAKCSPYRGWCNFGEAKKAAEHFLDACPLEVFHHFINHSWHFMSAY